MRESNKPITLRRILNNFTGRVRIFGRRCRDFQTRLRLSGSLGNILVSFEPFVHRVCMYRTNPICVNKQICTSADVRRLRIIWFNRNETMWFRRRAFPTAFFRRWNMWNLMKRKYSFRYRIAETLCFFDAWIWKILIFHKTSSSPIFQI